MNEKDLLKWLDMLGGRADPAFKQQSDDEKWQEWLDDFSRVEDRWDKLGEQWFYDSYLTPTMDRFSWKDYSAQQTVDIAYHLWFRNWQHTHEREHELALIDNELWEKNRISSQCQHAFGERVYEQEKEIEYLNNQIYQARSDKFLARLGWFFGGLLFSLLLLA